jgi:hypothetical protein
MGSHRLTLKGANRDPRPDPVIATKQVAQPRISRTCGPITKSGKKPHKVFRTARKQPIQTMRMAITAYWGTWIALQD